jgi:hypothetical protein
MTEQAQPRILSSINIPKTIAGTLAAVSAAVVGSYLGVAGTIIGAAVASLISSVGTEIYHRWVDHGTKKLQSAFVTAPAAVGTPEVAAAPEPPSQEVTPVRTRIRWQRVGVVASALFVLGLGTLTAVELLTGTSAGQATGGSGGSNPTVFQLSGNHRDADEKTTPATAPEESTPVTTETGKPGTTEPAGESTEPAGEDPATQAPETQAPETGTPETAAPETGTGEPETGTGEQIGAGEQTDSGAADGAGTATESE